MALRCFNPFVVIGGSSPVAFARTDNSGRPILRRHPLISLSDAPRACASRPRRDRAVCACTHYLVFKEPTTDAPLAPRRRCLGYPEVPVPPPGSRPGRPRRLSEAARLGEPSEVTRAHRSCQSKLLFCVRPGLPRMNARPLEMQLLKDLADASGGNTIC